MADKPLTGEELTERLKGWNPQIVPHEHTFIVQIADMCMVRWCTSCGKAWKCERPQNGSFFGDYWEPILERDEEK